MLNREFQYYLDNQPELVKKYNCKFIVIVGNEVVGDYATEIEAYNETQKQGHELGSFLIQHCLPGSESHTLTLHSRLVLAD